MLNIIPEGIGIYKHQNSISTLVNELKAIATPQAKYKDVTLSNGIITVVSDSAVTAPKTGYYIIIIKGTFAPNNNGRRIIGFSYNSTTTVHEWLNYQNTVQNDYTKNSVCEFIHLNANDIIRGALFQDSGGSLAAGVTVSLINIKAD